MINIISEDAHLNPSLTEFPTANANISIFGTQSSGKSTLLNSVFGTNFPTLNTEITRQRCTTGIWFQRQSNFNLIDTEGFDSIQRAPEEKILQKQMALFCLAISDVLMINMWMNEIGRYEGSHTHILKSILHASQKLLTPQTKKIILVVRDCTPDANRNILKQELNHNITAVLQNEPKSNLKLTIDYALLSHFEDNKKQFTAQCKQILKICNSVRKSNLNNYSAEDRLQYLKQLWLRIRTNKDIDLRSVEDALKTHALERIKQQAINYAKQQIDNTKNMDDPSYQKFLAQINSKIKEYIYLNRPIHLKQSELIHYIGQISLILQNKINKQFMTIILPAAEDFIIQNMYQKVLDEKKQKDMSNLNSTKQRKKKQLIDYHKRITKGLRDYAKLTRRFTEKIQQSSLKYDQYLQHLEHLFEIDLQKNLNEVVDNQIQKMKFNKQELNERIKKISQLHQLSSKNQINNIWEKVSNRAASNTLILKIKNQSEKASIAGSLIGDNIRNIAEAQKNLEKKAEEFLTGLNNFLTPENEPLIRKLDQIDSIKATTRQSLQRKIQQENQRFKITLFITVLFMFFFYSQFKRILSVFGMKKKRLNRWIGIYIFSMFSIFMVISLRNKDRIMKILKTYL